MAKSSRPDLFVLTLDGMEQSAVDLADPTRLVFDYVRRIGDVIDRLPTGPLRVVHVGGAAMTLPRYVAATRPRSSQIVLEPDAEVVALVRAEAPLPKRSGIRVREIDGLTGVAALAPDSADLLILDAFAGGVVPAELTSLAFFAEVRRVLGETGVLVANLTDAAPFPRVRDAVAGLRAVFAEVVIGIEPATLKARRPGNLLVVAGPALGEPFGAPAPSSYRIFTGTKVSDSFGGGSAE
ncbi:spermidine synthase [Nocardioides sp.]|uniref:spermidine synthase n=1 Tax=Nocardioides sp. TaxID=35761 RepID=UPI0039E584E6